MHILIMEDDAGFAFEMRDFLELEGYQVSWARDASEALDVLTHTGADLVVADIYIMRDGAFISDGGIRLIGVKRLTRYQSDTRDISTIPVIAISGAGNYPGNRHVLDVAKSVGADYVLAKPFELSELLDIIQTALAPAQAADDGV